jgi:hypothetical protein
VTASAWPGWTFLYWLGDAEGTDAILSLDITRNKYVEAVFGVPLTAGPQPLAMYPQGNLYPYGTFVKLTAIPPPGQYFVQWLANVGLASPGTNNPAVISLTNPSPVTATWLSGTLGLGETSLTVIENGRGRVALFPQKYHYFINEFAGLIALPDAGQDFIGWSGDASGNQNSIVVSMAQTRVITATFTKRPSLEVGTPLEGLVEDGFRLTLMGEFETNYAILGSTNLADWSSLGIVTNTHGTVQFTDSGATNLGLRFYRAVAR